MQCATLDIKRSCAVTPSIDEAIHRRPLQGSNRQSAVLHWNARWPTCACHGLVDTQIGENARRGCSMDKPHKLAKRRTRRTFSSEFKSGAVRLCSAGARSTAHIAIDIDLTETSLREGRIANIGATEGHARSPTRGRAHRARTVVSREQTVSDATARFQAGRGRFQPVLAFGEGSALRESRSLSPCGEITPSSQTSPHGESR